MTGVLNKCMPFEHATTLQIGKLGSLRDPCDQKRIKGIRF